jgi:hypothetical protein
VEHLRASSQRGWTLSLVDLPDEPSETEFAESRREYVLADCEGGPYDVVLVDGIDGAPPPTEQA